MVKRALRKNSIREIKLSIGRYIAILAIVALGVGFFAGLKVSKEAMVQTGDEYFRENALFDFRLISTLGLYDEDIDSIKEEDFVTLAEGSHSFDAIVEKEDKTSTVFKLMELPKDINRIILVSGRMPESSNECLVDSKIFGEDICGKTLTVSDTNEEATYDAIDEKELTVVGTCQSVVYVNFERGNTSLGSGKISGFLYIPKENFVCDYYTEIYVVTKASSEKIYTDEYNDEIERESDILETKLSLLANGRYTDLVNDANEEIDDAQVKLDDARKEISDNEKKIEDANIEIQDAESEIKEKRAELESASAELESMKAFMPASMYQEKKAEIDAYNAELDKGEDSIADSKKEIEDANERIKEAKIEVDEHQKELDEAKEKLEDLDEPDTYVLDRKTNIGYACFENDSSIVEGIGNVFPVFFFLVAALVCMTTMNRMVEEKRTEIGTMKALGYSEASIMGKYLFYSGSAAIIGCIGGFILGSKLFPTVIWNAYGIMYTMKDIVFVFDKTLAAVSLVVAILCSMGATYVTLDKELKSNAADLIRPKAPENGKRVFLERIGFIWNKMKFTSKVSVRNVFRYKKRFWMMILGVGGCYGLLITGFGIKDSIADVCDCQFNNIQKYDITVSFKDDVSLNERDKFIETVDGNGEYIYAVTKRVDVSNSKGVKSATMVVFADNDGSKTGNDFINFCDEDDNPLELPDTDEAIISAKMAKMLDVQVGDEIVLRDPDLNEIRVCVSGIMKNYVDNWAYVSSDTYRKQRKIEPYYNSAFVNSKVDGYELSANISSLDIVSSVSVTDELSVRIDSMMSSLNQVVLLVISCAAALAFIVMYNLTNINITERLREIATLKVLGFYSKETAVYVFRENLILTAFGIIAGLFMGYGLHRYVMMNINVEVVTFDTKILPISYAYGVILTFLFALFVDFVLMFKLEKIKMAESLKSVE